MSYVDAWHDRTRDIVHVSERVNGKRVLVTHKPVYNFYYQDPKGKARSVYGEPLTEVRCANSKDFKNWLHWSSTIDTDRYAKIKYFVW